MDQNTLEKRRKWVISHTMIHIVRAMQLLLPYRARDAAYTYSSSCMFLLPFHLTFTKSIFLHN